MTERWSADQNLKFVELYKDQTVLWNYLDPNYKNRNLRQESLEHIRNKMGLQATSDVTRKIKNLRSTYNQEMIKIEKSKKSTNTDDIYRPSIKWFDSMDYIMKIINLKEKKTTSTLEPLHSTMSLNEFPYDYSLSNDEDLNTGTNDSNSTEIKLMKPPKKPRTNMKLPQETSDIQAAVNELKELNYNLIMSSSKESEDECDVFGKHVSIQLRQLPPIDRIDAIDEMQALLSRYRKKVLGAGNVNTPSNYYSRECSPSPQSTVGFPLTSSHSTKTMETGIQNLDPLNVIYMEKERDVKPDISNIDVSVSISNVEHISNITDSENMEDDITVKREILDEQEHSWPTASIHANEKIESSDCYSGFQNLLFSSIYDEICSKKSKLESHGTIPEGCIEDSSHFFDRGFNVFQEHVSSDNGSYFSIGEDDNHSSDEWFDSENDLSNEEEEIESPNADNLPANNLEVNSDGNSNPTNEWGPVEAKPREFNFSGREQLLIRAPQSADGKVWPIDVFKQIITDDVINLIVGETNRYAIQKLASAVVSKSSKTIKWAPTTKEEIEKFIGLTIYMGLLPLPDIQLYWSKMSLYKNSIVPEIMARDRFLQLLRMLHFCNNDDANVGRDYKIRALLNMIVGQCQNLYEPGPDLVIDKSLVPFKGVDIFRRNLPIESHTNGCKLYKICTTDGYTVNLELYGGAGLSDPPLSPTESLVVRLLHKYLDKGFTLFADKYYISNFLGEYLLHRRTYLCGTVRVNRKNLPNEVMRAKLKRGEMKAKQSRKGVKVFNWKDRRNVITLSTVPEHDETLKDNGSRTGSAVAKPQSVLDYNARKKGVDFSDQLSSNYSPLKKSRKWYKKVAIELLTGTAVVNAWVLYNKFYAEKKMSMREFKESIVLNYCRKIHKEPMKPGRSSLNIAGPSGHHLVQTEGPKRYNRKRCRGCYETISKEEGSNAAKRKSKKVSTYCGKCEGSPHLCLTCFAAKHSK